MAAREQYVRKQHYIPQFSIRPFEISKGKCLCVNVTENPLAGTLMKTENIMQNIDFYEVKDASGDYVNRNEMESSYSKFENEIAKKFRRIISLLDSNQADQELKKMIKTNEWADKEVTLLLHLTLNLIRSPQVKSLIYDSKTFPDFLKPIFYRLMTTSQTMAVNLAKDHLIGDELETAMQFLKTSSESGLQLIAEHLFNKFQLRVYKAKGEKKIFFSDSPILIQEFKDTDYLIPITPSICIGATPIQIKDNNILITNHITYLNDYEVERINKKIVLNAQETLVIHHRSDINFIEKIMKRPNN